MREHCPSYREGAKKCLRQKTKTKDERNKLIMKISSVVLCAVLALVSTAVVLADSFQVQVPPSASGGALYVSYLYTNAGVATALPGAAWGIRVCFWDVPSQDWINSEAKSLRTGQWVPGTNVLTPGRCFSIQTPLTNSGPLTYTVAGTPSTASSYTNVFGISTNFYLVGSSYTNNPYTFLCCAVATRCTPNCYNYQPSVGDVVFKWDGTEWVGLTNNSAGQWQYSGGTNGVNYAPQLGYSLPAFLDDIGEAVFILPAGGTSNWVQYINNSVCQ